LTIYQTNKTQTHTTVTTNGTTQKIATYSGGSQAPSNKCFLWPTQVTSQTGSAKYQKQPKITYNNRKLPKTANQKTELFSITSQIKLTLTITLTLTDTVTLTSQPNRKHRKHRKQTENNRKVFGCFRCLATPSQTGLWLIAIFWVVPLKSIGSLCYGVHSKRDHSVVNKSTTCDVAFCQNSLVLFALQSFSHSLSTISQQVVDVFLQNLGNRFALIQKIALFRS